MWVAEQEEKMEMSLNERKRWLRSFEEGVAAFWGPAGQGCCPASCSLLFPMANPSASPSFHLSERHSECVCPLPTWLTQDPAWGWHTGSNTCFEASWVNLCHLPVLVRCWICC